MVRSSSSRVIDGTVIKTGDMQIYISSIGLPIVPGPGDIVTANGTDYTVIASDPNSFDGVTPVVHILQGRVAA
ncbi:hypothetical protein IB238_09090 [Rhizobium sp. ARZ01]|nr:hypothetical protein [Rhizobium sp. ARZ01]